MRLGNIVKQTKRLLQFGLVASPVAAATALHQSNYKFPQLKARHKLLTEVDLNQEIKQTKQIINAMSYMKYGVFAIKANMHETKLEQLLEKKDELDERTANHPSANC